MPITTRTLVTSGLASDAFRSRTSDRPSWPQRRAAAVIRDQSQATAAQDPDRWIPYVPTGDGIPPRSADLERRRSVLLARQAVCARFAQYALVMACTDGGGIKRYWAR
jgi:hypothetical protein